MRAFLKLAAVMATGLAALPFVASAQDTQGARPAAAPTSQKDMPAFVRRGLPGDGHAALKPLEGTFRVRKSIYAAIGTPDKPAVSEDLMARRTWVGGGRFLQDVTEGTIAGGPYWRMGLLGYSTVDRRYEWVTADAMNANLMIYLGAPGSGPQVPFTVSGTFTDQGVLGEQTVGKPVAMRTVFRIESNDRHVTELYFTPPGGTEMLIDHSIYTRIGKK